MSYAKTRRTLAKPAKSVLDAIADGKLEDRAARAAVRAMLAAPGADPWALYRAETDKPRRVALLGFLRRGPAALEDR